jgi:DNA recombination protein RmuC
MQIYFYIIIAVLVVFLVAQLWLLWRSRAALGAKLKALQDGQERTDRSIRDTKERSDRFLRDEMERLRAEVQMQAERERAETAGALKAFGDSVQTRLAEMSGLQNDQMGNFSRQITLMTSGNDRKMEEIRQVIDSKLEQIRADNSRQLELVRETVDEKLQSTLEKRLGDSFRQVSERLELVHQGLGDMRNLAAGVGDLKKVLTNVKSRGTWGEVQLGSLLEEILSPEQYLANVKIKETDRDFVEFAIKLPGQGDSPADFVLIPVDAKFPMEDYARLMDAQERSDAAAADDALRQLEAGIKKAARDISTKYVVPPRTTDFGIMFLPSEGLYAEVIRRTQLVSVLQREHRIIVSGPSTFAAFLNSLQMGFRTLAIQKRSGEVWKVLGEVKTAFTRFGDSLDAVRKRLDQASNSVEDAQKKTRTLAGKLKAVEALPEAAETIEITDQTPD